MEELVLAEKIIAHLIKREQARGGQGAWKVAWWQRSAACGCQLVGYPGRPARASSRAPPPPHRLTTFHRHARPSPQVLLVVEQPERAADEAAADYAKRLQNERVLALNPNYSAE